MVKKISVTLLLVVIFGILIFGAVNRSKAKVSTESENVNTISYGTGIVSANNGQLNGKNGSNQGIKSAHTNEVNNLPTASQDGLSNIEKAGLIYMREEEKLAHDVYVAFYSLYQTQNFQNISQSEMTHADAVKTLLDRYGIPDPASNELGIFANPDLQALFNELLSLGSQSLADALKVSAAIEEIDIMDLREYMAGTDNADIRQVYDNLLKGSENHLRAFVAKLQKESGEIYQPQYLNLDQFQSIINADTQVGGGNQGSGGGNGGYRNGQP